MAKDSCGSLGTMEEVEKVFSRFDKNGDGKISAEEFAEVLRALGSHTSPDELTRIMSEIDTDGDGFIDLKEFADFHRATDSNGGLAELRDAFDMYDRDKNGLISASELHAVFKSLGEKVTLKDCSRMISSVDADGDGCVNFEEFKKMMTRSWSFSGSLHIDVVFPCIYGTTLSLLAISIPSLVLFAVPQIFIQNNKIAQSVESAKLRAELGLRI